MHLLRLGVHRIREGDHPIGAGQGVRGRRADADVRPHPGDDDRIDVLLTQIQVQVRMGKTAVAPLGDDVLVAHRLQLLDEVRPPGPRHGVAGPHPEVRIVLPVGLLDMDDLDIVALPPPDPGQQPLDIGDYFLPVGADQRPLLMNEVVQHVNNQNRLSRHRRNPPEIVVCYSPNKCSMLFQSLFLNHRS